MKKRRSQTAEIYNSRVNKPLDDDPLISKIAEKCQTKQGLSRNQKLYLITKTIEVDSEERQHSKFRLDIPIALPATSMPKLMFIYDLPSSAIRMYQRSKLQKQIHRDPVSGEKISWNLVSEVNLEQVLLSLELPSIPVLPPDHATLACIPKFTKGGKIPRHMPLFTEWHFQSHHMTSYCIVLEAP